MYVWGLGAEGRSKRHDAGCLGLYAFGRSRSRPVRSSAHEIHNSTIFHSTPLPSSSVGVMEASLALLVSMVFETFPAAVELTEANQMHLEANAG